MSYNVDEKLYTAFHRTWWKYNEAWPKGLEPEAGPKTILGRGLTWSEARELCDLWNASHDPGPLSRKAEFMEEGR